MWDSTHSSAQGKLVTGGLLFVILFLLLIHFQSPNNWGKNPNPSASKVKLMHSGGDSNFALCILAGRAFAPIGPMRVPFALVSTHTRKGSYGSTL